MFRTGLIIGAHREELAFGERTSNRIKKSGIEVIRMLDGIPNCRTRGELKSSQKTDLDNLYSRIHRKVCGKYDLVIDLHSGLCEEEWSADIFSSEMGFLDFMDAGLKKIFRDKFHLPDKIRLFKILRNDQAAKAFDDRFPVCLAFVPENIVKGKHYHYVGLEVYLTSQEGCRSEYRLSRRLILAVHECAIGYASRKALRVAQPPAFPV